MSSTGSATPGWYPDPNDPSQIRYWDGLAWTEAVAPATESAAQAADPGFAPPAGAAGQTPGYQAPGYQAPGYQAPGPAAPGYQGPGQPGYQQYYQPALTGPPHGLGQIGNWLSSLFTILIQQALPVLALLLVPPAIGWIALQTLGWSFLRGLAFDSRTDEVTGFSVGPLIGMGVVLFLMGLFAMVGWLAANHHLHRAHSGRPETLGQSLGYGFKRLPRAIGWGLVAGILGMLLVGLLVLPVVALAAATGPEGLFILVLVVPLAIVVGIFLWIRLAFFGVALAVGPRGVNPFSASWRVSEGRFWPLFGRLLLLYVVIYGIQTVGGIILQIGFGAVFATVGVETSPTGDDLLINGVPVDQLDVIEFSQFLPNPFLTGFLLLLYVVMGAVTQSVWASGLTGLYQRADGPSDLNQG